MNLTYSIDAYLSAVEALKSEKYDEAADDINCQAECEDNQALLDALEQQGFEQIYSSPTDEGYDLYANQSGKVLAVYLGPLGPINFFVEIS